MTDVFHYSASQIERAQGCARKWAYSKIRPRGPSTPAAEKGTAMHLVLERWLRDGTPPDPLTEAGRTAITGLHLIPLPKTCAVEVAIDHMLPGAKGRIDFFDWQTWGAIVIGDHKSVGDWSIAAEKDPRTDPQRIVYSHAVLQKFPDQIGVWFLWVFYLRGKDQPARPLWYWTPREQSDRDFAELERTTINTMRQSFEHPLRTHDPERWIAAHPRTLTYCSRFGGCPYRGECLATVPPLELARTALAL